MNDRSMNVTGSQISGNIIQGNSITTIGITLKIVNFAKSEWCRFPSRSTFQDAFLII